MTASQGRTGTVYYGWIMVAICMFVLMLTIGTTVNAFGLYVVPVSDAYGLSRATMNTGMILMNGGSAVAALIVGQLLDRYSIRLIMGLSGLTLAACLITFGLSHSIWLSAVLISLPVGAAMKGIGILTAPALVARWFVVHRGKAMAITMMGMSLGTIFIVPLIAWLIETVGWRDSLVVLGCAVAVLVTGVLPWVRNGPGANDYKTGKPASPQTDAEPADPEDNAEPLSTKRLFRMPRFWTIALATALPVAVFQGVLVSLVPIALDLGFSTTTAATLMSAIGAAGIAGKFGVAWVADRFERPVILAMLFGLMALGNAAFLLADSYELLITCCVLAGLAAGGTMPVFLALLADQFGANSIGSANGSSTFVIAVVSACSVRFSGEVYDRTGAYDLMFYSYAAIAILAAFLMFTVRALKTSGEVVSVASS